MKIWIVKLKVFMQDETTPSIDFSIEKSNDEYCFNKTNKEYETHSRFYIINSVSQFMRIRYFCGAIIAEQGFEKEPIQEQVEKDMREYLIEFFKKSRQEALELYDKKINLLQEMKLKGGF